MTEVKMEGNLPYSSLIISFIIPRHFHIYVRFLRIIGFNATIISIASIVVVVMVVVNAPFPLISNKRPNRQNDLSHMQKYKHQSFICVSYVNVHILAQVLFLGVITVANVHNKLAFGRSFINMQHFWMQMIRAYIFKKSHELATITAEFI